ncbi:DNA translocase FtsK 4TM domain-containing protein [Aquimarina gracilis]|uniref:DNA translocase FtsK 4TM domain-containing protein n=1 Tax=Aquimarina gracilis TaxID=874422 RepID=A0ABU5ZW20_9FLAO|nr:DNA translocase FtsK 4TM domain-containing protein [Aquimarina gracilis]MEB3346062.1 DNA translocase FtsK 4TM domain-containing protein [Aquimarina gracilis]
MAKKRVSTKRKTTKKPKTPLKQKLALSRQQKVVLGSFLFFLGIGLFFAFISFFFNWKIDQSEISQFYDRASSPKNWLSKFGATVSHFFIFKGFGVSSLILPVLTSLTGIYLFFDLNKKKLAGFWFWGTLVMIWISVVLGFIKKESGLLAGVVGYETNDFLQDYVGFIGTVLILAFFAIVYIVVRLRYTPERLTASIKSTQKDIARDFESTPTSTSNTVNNNGHKVTEKQEEESGSSRIKERIDAIIARSKDIGKKEEPKKEVVKKDLIKKESETNEITLNPTINDFYGNPENRDNDVPEKLIIKSEDNPEDIAMEVEKVSEEEVVRDKDLSAKLVKDFGEFDPKLELGNYKFPGINLLKDYTGQTGSITIDQGELEENKNRIVETLKNYKIEIAQIKATVGPTVTLYEIVPEAGIRISKIKNLEDDIALSLAALGIRIIAPIPGKGTIGIEVPNKKSTIVSMRSAIASSKFQNAEMELPLSLGKTISNETFVVDLAKMPHLLMAGATGQGKSVGLNAILTSLLYKKHPAEVKFVLVDPKKVELTLFNKIERHYLAKLPDTEEAIITDNTKVINTLNSLCIEMDARYDLLKNAMVRNIKEYNAKFKARKLNPENGHRFLPYIVLVVDEFADLIMTAGKEVETPIARLAQLARAIGIHLIIATQRPSVNVITGMIKANFPARIAFRVTSKIDSRTILDTGGADQLIGRGDMLFTQGNEIIRIQCAFVDTPEVERITEFIGSQKAYPDAHLLPEYVGEESGTSLDIDKKDRDKLFNEAAEVIVTAQQGSASLLQRKLKLGYNRAGRLIDQLEAAGVVGPFEGSKARQVLVNDLVSLQQLLDNEK